MSTLEMNTDVARAAVRKLEEAAASLSQALRTTDTSRHSLEGSWSGESYDQFSQEYADWHRNVNNMLEQVQALANQLREIIRRKEQADQQFG